MSVSPLQRTREKRYCKFRKKIHKKITEENIEEKANKPSFRKRTSKFEKAVQKFASEREESSHPPLTVRNLTGNAPRKHWVTKGRLSNPVVTGMFRRGQHSSIMNRALPLNELNQAYLENDLHRIIDLANKQSRSVRSSQDNGNAKSRRSLVPRLYGQTEEEAVDSPTLPALVGFSPLCFSPQASSTHMVHGPYAPVSGGPPNKSTLNLSTSSSSDEDNSHILGYQAFSAACERSVSVVSKRLGKLCKFNHLQGVRRKLQDTFVKSHSKDPPVSCSSHSKDPPVSCFSHSKDPPVSYSCFSHSKDPPVSYSCFSHSKDPPVSCFSHSKDPPVSSQRCDHTNPQQTTATQTKQSECHESTSPSSQETLSEHLPLSETILDPLEYLKKAFGDAPMNFNYPRTVEKNRSKEATVSTHESDMSRFLDTHVCPSTSWEHGSLQQRDRDWYSPDPREMFQRESRVYQEPERRMPCASYPYQGSSVKEYQDEAQLHFPASSATEISPETRFASLVTSPPAVYWKRSMF